MEICCTCAPSTSQEGNYAKVLNTASTKNESDPDICERTLEYNTYDSKVQRLHLM